MKKLITSTILVSVLCMSFKKKHHMCINGHKAVVVEHCYKYHIVTHVINRVPTKGNSYDTDIQSVKICDSATYDTFYKN